MSKNRKDSLGDRMKTYEAVTRNFLTRRTPVIIRLDGCHFHTFTRGFDKPYDKVLSETMQETMKYLCENIQGCVMGYTQSDEITLVLCDYKKLTTAAWYDNNIQKMCSVSAAMASSVFNNKFNAIAINKYTDYIVKKERDSSIESLFGHYFNARRNIVTFDSRVFNLPKEEVCNCLIWRQQDATRNSIEGLGQKYFSHKELMGKNCDMVQDMLMVQRGINWNDVPTKFKRGSCCIKDEDGWFIDNEIPIFTKDREYVESRIVFEDE